ncbi:zinc finger protein 271-like [Penaeus japonicus]|uniref:zinc finger protein 271-like n=1 Tax=Penaeus japonicus TaxID=27405 RepID=UPI001C70B9F9|nr:zinc finger protein 271-like [Penaeus japonicus]
MVIALPRPPRPGGSLEFPCSAFTSPVQSSHGFGERRASCLDVEGRQHSGGRRSAVWRTREISSNHFVDRVEIRDSSNEIEDSDDALPTATFVAEDFEPKGSSDEDRAAHREGHEELRNYDKKRKCIVCEVCGKKYLYKIFLTKHMRVHTKDKLYSSNLVAHMRVHTKEKPYSCEICEKAFSHKHSLVLHMRVHTNEKPYSCEVCERAFSREHSLVLHMRIHTKEKPYRILSLQEICEEPLYQRRHRTVGQIGRELSWKTLTLTKACNLFSRFMAKTEEKAAMLFA